MRYAIRNRQDVKRNTQYARRIRYYLSRITGFTLIELLVVIAVIGILTSLMVVNFNAARARARDARRKADLDQVKKAALMYFNDNTEYPDSLVWGAPLQTAEMIYMKLLPHDPLFTGDPASPEYNYQVSVSPLDFCLWADLENKSDPDIDNTKQRCETSCSNAGMSFGADDYVFVVCPD